MIRVSDEYFRLAHEYDPLDNAPDYPELDPYPPNGVSLEDYYAAATPDFPLRFAFDSGDMPDFPSVAPYSRLCSERLRALFDRLKAPADLIHWAPSILHRRSDGRDFKYWCLLFSSPTDVRYYSWFDRVRARFLARRHRLDNTLSVAARTPYILDKRTLDGARVFSYDRLFGLYAHHRVVDALKAERITNLRFVNVREHR